MKLFIHALAKQARERTIRRKPFSRAGRLFIDTSDNQKTIVGLDDKRLEMPTGQDKSQQVLVLIDKILKSQKKKMTEITEIEVVTGPGSFTGLRVGVAVANTLAFALQIPVNKKPLETNLNYS